MRLSVVLLLLLLAAVTTAWRQFLRQHNFCQKFPDRPCGDGWSHIDANRCAKYIESRLNYYDAKERCRSEGSELVSVHSKDQMLEVFCLSLRARDFQRTVWIRARREQGGFRFLDGSEFDYNGWSAGQPNAAEDCVEADFWQDGRWKAVRCSETKHFVCIKKM